MMLNKASRVSCKNCTHTHARTHACTCLYFYAESTEVSPVSPALPAPHASHLDHLLAVNYFEFFQVSSQELRSSSPLQQAQQADCRGKERAGSRF